MPLQSEVFHATFYLAYAFAAATWKMDISSWHFVNLLIIESSSSSDVLHRPQLKRLNPEQTPGCS